VFAIVTRNKLYSRRHAISMIWAWWHVRRQLAATPGMLRYTTGIANLKEFFTLTLWEREFDMYRFMSSAAHAQMMWNFRKWDESFWSMRFDPCKEEVGAWNGRRFSGRRAGVPAKRGTFADEIPEELLRHLPLLHQYRTQPSGCERLDIEAVIGRVSTASPVEVWRLRRLMRGWGHSNAIRRFAVGVGAGECLLLAVWQQARRQGALRFLESLRNDLPGAWAMRFQATDFEVGHWDWLRLRDLGAIQ